MEFSKEKHSFLKGTLSLTIAVIVTKILGVMYKIPLSYVLGDEGMGYFNSAYAIYGFIYILCTAGVPKAMSLTAADCKNSYPEVLMEDILRRGISIFFKIGISATLLIMMSAPFLVRVMGSGNSLYSIIAISPSIVFVSVSGVLRGYHNTSGNLVCIAVSQLQEALIKLACGLIMAYLGLYARLSLPMISALSISGITIGSIISCIYLYSRVNLTIIDDKTRQKIISNRKGIGKKLLKSALPISLGSSVLNIASILDLGFMMNRLLESGLSEADATAVYGNYTTLAVPMFNLVISLISPLTMAYLPKLSEAYYSGNKDTFRSEGGKMLIIVNIVSIPCAMMFLLYSFDILDVLFSVNSAAVGADMLAALSIGLCFLVLLTTVNTALEAQGKIRITLISLFFGAIVKMAATYFLMNNSAIGILGVPFGTVISYVASLFVSLYAFSISEVRFRVFAPTLIMIVSAFLSFCPIYIVIYSRGIITNSLISLIACGALSLLIYLVSLTIIYFAFSRYDIFNMHKKDKCSLSVRTKM